MVFSCCKFDGKQILHLYGLVVCIRDISRFNLGCSLVVLVILPDTCVPYVPRALYFTWL